MTLKIFRATNSVDDTILLQSDTERTQGRCAASFMELNSSKNLVFSLEKNIIIYCNDKLWDSSITRSDAIRDLIVQLETKLHFHTHTFYVHVTVYRVKFLIIKPTRCTIFSNLFLE